MVTTVLVSEEEKKLLEEAQDQILQAGLSALDTDIIKELEDSKINVRRFTRGTIVAIGAACILVEIKKRKR